MKIPNNIIVLDLEATCCWSNDNLPENAIHETIEIGAVRIINGKMDVKTLSCVRRWETDSLREVL